MLNHESMANVITSNDISKLETLSNELLISIFEYATPRDLMHGLWNLNHRLNRIINSSKICLTMFPGHRRTHSEDQNDIELLHFFASRLYSLDTGFNNKEIPIDLSQCSQLRILKTWMMKEEDFVAVRPSIMPHLQHLVIRRMWFDRQIFFDRLANEQFSSLTTLQLHETKFKSKSNYKPIPYIKSLSGICCMWDDFNSIFTVFPQLRRLSLSLYTYRENPRWASIKPFKLSLNTLNLKFSSEMVTPDDDPVFPLMIDTRLRQVELDASISRHNGHLLLIDILPQIVQRIENVIEQKATEKSCVDGNLEALFEAHLACQDISWCILYMESRGWGYIDTES